MKAIIKLDVPDWQIGQPISVYFPDTMLKKGICEAAPDTSPKKKYGTWVCGNCGFEVHRNWMHCHRCGQELNFPKEE